LIYLKFCKTDHTSFAQYANADEFCNNWSGRRLSNLTLPTGVYDQPSNTYPNTGSLPVSGDYATGQRTNSPVGRKINRHNKQLSLQRPPKPPMLASILQKNVKAKLLPMVNTHKLMLKERSI
jgi:hypothetical protein